MSYQPFAVFTATLASGATTVAFTLDRGYTNATLELPTLSTSTAWDVYCSTDGSTYRPAFERVNTAPVQYQTLTVASGVGANGGAAQLAVVYPYLQLRASSAVGNGASIKLICWD
jgi:hypothetical protein